MVSVLGTGLSRVLGAVRDIVVATLFGAGAGSDAFWVAFTVPNTFRRFVADEGLTGAIVPAIAKAESEDDSGSQLANTLFTGLLAANLILCILGFVYTEWLVKAFAYSFTEDPAKFALTVRMTRWMFPFVAMVSVVSFFEGLLNHRGHFFIPKVAPGLVSLGIAGAAIGLSHQLVEPLMALAYGVLAGGTAHVVIHIPVLRRVWGRLSLGFDFANPRVRQVGREMSKVFVIGIFAQLNILVLRQLAAMLGDGAITRYWYANRLVDLSQGMIAVAIGSALLPNISQAAAALDFKQFRADLHQALRLAGFILIPVAVCLVPYAIPLTAMLFRHGHYSWEDVLWTSWTLQALTPFLLGVAGINIIKKAYFALNDRNTLLAIGLAGVVLTALIGWALVNQWNVVGLAIALSISTWLQLIGYVVLLHRRIDGTLGLGVLGDPYAKIVGASIAPVVILAIASGYGSWEFGPARLGNWVVFSLGAIVAVIAYAAGAKVLKIPEFEAVTRRLFKRHNA
jgi:putative peptidoglycan lipid II flippase